MLHVLMKEIPVLYLQAGLPDMESCLSEAHHRAETGDTVEAVKFYLLSTAPEDGLELGLTEVKG